MKRIIAFFCFVAVIFTFAACGKGEMPLGFNFHSGTSDTNGKIVKLLLSPYGNRVSLKTYEIKKDYVSVTSNSPFTEKDLNFVSEDEDIAKIEYISTPLEGCICYSLEGVHYGTTYVYIETADGKIRTQRIKVVVDKETVTTTEPLTLRSYSYTGEDYYPSTSSTKSTDDEDENETTSETKTNSYTDKPEFSTSDNSEYTPPTVPPTAPPTEPPPTQPPVTVPPTAIVEPQE